MKKHGLTLFIGVLVGSLIGAMLFSVSGEAFKKRLFGGAHTGTWANGVDSISFTLTEEERIKFEDNEATWDRMVGVFDIENHVPVSSIDSLGKRDTVIVTLKSVGLDDLRIDTLQVDTLVGIRDRSEIKYNFTNLITRVEHYGLDMGDIKELIDDGQGASPGGHTTVIRLDRRFSFELEYLTFDVHLIDSVMGADDTAIFKILWFIEFVDEK